MGNRSLRTKDAQNGTFLRQLGELVLYSEERRFMRFMPRRSCPVCCRFIARDRDMIAIWRSGVDLWVCLWVCLSNLEMGDEECGFAYPWKMSQRRIDQLAAERGRFLNSRLRRRRQTTSARKRGARMGSAVQNG